MKNPRRTRSTPFVERLLEAAEHHGKDDDPDHEVGDLQTLVRDLWSTLTMKQRATFAERPEWRDFIKDWAS